MIAESVIRNKLSRNLHKAETIAATDALTGLLNRASFIPRAEAVFDRSRKNSQPVSVMFLDIDHFKKVNDNYGHAFGDEVLVRFAEVLRSSIRPGDLCARYGGEEFVIMLGEGKKQNALKVAERIMDSLKALRFSQYPEFTFTASIGLMYGAAQEGDTLQSYIEKADAALYEAKNSGRNRVVLFTEMNQRP